MCNTAVFTAWRPETARLWGNVPLRLEHSLADEPLFSHDALARLIEIYPREHYQVVQWDNTPGGKSREGELGNISGDAAMEAVAKGRVWINLRSVPKVDRRYGILLEKIFGELETRLPGFSTTAQTLGILISSPNSRTHYHADLPGQSLWQIRGRKRVYVFPPVEPFVSRQQIERITLSKSEKIPFEPWFDDHATVIDLEPGQMLQWQLNAPHRVDNHDCMNVSVTLEYFTPEIRRRFIVNRANAILRHVMHLTPKGTAIDGPNYWIKAALQKALRDTPLVARRDETRRPATFRLDPNAPGSVAELRV